MKETLILVFVLLSLDYLTSFSDTRINAEKIVQLQTIQKIRGSKHLSKTTKNHLDKLEAEILNTNGFHSFVNNILNKGKEVEYYSSFQDEAYEQAMKDNEREFEEFMRESMIPSVRAIK